MANKRIDNRQKPVYRPPAGQMIRGKPVAPADPARPRRANFPAPAKPEPPA